MKFNITERLLLLQMLPNEANYVTFKIITNLKNELSFSEEELKDFGLETVVNDDGTTTAKWNPLADSMKEIEIGDKGRDIIKGAFIKLDEQGKINASNERLYEKFVLE